MALFLWSLNTVMKDLSNKKYVMSQIDYCLDLCLNNISIFIIITICLTVQWHTTIDVIDCPRMKRCIDIAQICVNKDPKKRPTTGEIIQILNEAETMDHGSQTYKQNINEPRNDPRSPLHQV